MKIPSKWAGPPGLRYVAVVRRAREAVN